MILHLKFKSCRWVNQIAHGKIRLHRKMTCMEQWHATTIKLFLLWENCNLQLQFKNRPLCASNFIYLVINTECFSVLHVMLLFSCFLKVRYSLYLSYPSYLRSCGFYFCACISLFHNWFSFFFLLHPLQCHHQLMVYQNQCCDIMQKVTWIGKIIILLSLN